MPDRLTISDLELWTHIGVTDEERKTGQRVLVTVALELDLSKAGASDDVNDTIDYAAVVNDLRALAKTPRKTLEKFAEDCAQMILARYETKSATVEVKKFALPEATFSSVRVTRPQH